MSLTTAVQWVRRGKAAQHPEKYELDGEELARVSKLAKLQLDEANLDLAAAQSDWEDTESDDEEMDGVIEATARVKVDPDDLGEYNLDDYDAASRGTGINVRGLQMHRDEADDPYVSLDGQQEDEAEEREELEILPTDSLLVVARTEDALSQLDVYVYDDSQENLYIHHDLLLPAMPLCLEWLDFTPAPGEDNTRRQLGQAGNFIAVGTLDPEIEIWSLDIIDGLYPDAILGRSAADRAAAEAIVAPPPANGRKKPKRPKKPKPAKSDQFHIDSILSLSWNRTHRSLLASASADTTVKLWDLNRPGSAGALRSFDTHTDKVQAVEWNPAEPTVLASGGWDKVLRVYDSRNPGNTVGARVDSDLECLRWHSWSPAEILVSLESGLVQAFDTRKMSASLDAPAALWTLAAHDGSASTVDYSPLIPGFLVTGGVDGNVKLWSVDSTSASTKVSLVASRDLSVGKVFSATCCPDDATTIAVAGSKGSMQLWDTSANAGVRSTFGDRLRALGLDPARRRENGGVIGLLDDGEGSEQEPEPED